jgi:hypothetical protein
MERAASIFQIVPVDDTQFGKMIELSVGTHHQVIGFTHLLLRNVITGRYNFILE